MDIKSQFPIFKKNKNLVYLDSAATSLKPENVIKKTTEYYECYSANVKRGIYSISEKATLEYEKTRDEIARFINARPKEIVFTGGTTYSLNLLAYSLGRKIINRGDEVAVTVVEHHSNFIPWQQLAFENDAIFKVFDIDDSGYLNIKDVEKNINKKTKIVALTYVSNMLGMIYPIKKIVQAIKKINKNTIVIVDCAQAVPHMKVNVKDLGCDFIAFSGHKMLGPTGIGILWGKYDLLCEMFPFMYGGEMMKEVTIEKSVFADPPDKFEAGTPPIAQVIGLSEAINFINKIKLENIFRHEKELTKYAMNLLKSELKNEITIYGPENLSDRAGIITFNLKGIHPHDIASILNDSNICIRAGHHCTMQLHRRFNISSSCRISLYIYNTKQDIDLLIKNLLKIQKMFK
jgi:cysteine desulfurase/selenocysteine lyase